MMDMSSKLHVLVVPENNTTQQDHVDNNIDNNIEDIIQTNKEERSGLAQSVFLTRIKESFYHCCCNLMC